jgi:formylglycine-generating enzyme required for sulfatase activity
MKLVLIPAGRFVMGSADSEPERYADEGPQREVVISRPFYLGVYPVTQREYEALMGKNPTHFHSRDEDGSDHPVDSMSWEKAVEFCKRLSNLPQEKAAGRVYRLPTEAEWEYACRAGTTTPFWWGDNASTKQANFDGNYPYGGAAEGPYLKQPTKVGTFQPNPWGLYDVHGNVWEWCGDWYDENYYRQGENKDPQGPQSGPGRVLRGGSWRSNGWLCRAASRGHRDPGRRSQTVGFRVAVMLSPKTP